MAYNWLGHGFVPLALTYGISFIALLIGSITDLKTREVPDVVNYGLVISGIGLNLLFSAIYSDASFIINSLVGLAIFFGIAYIMFYMGQWGGGDSKMIMGLGAMIGIDVSFKAPQFLAGFFINALLAGAVYGLLWSAFLVARNRKKFAAEFAKILAERRIATLKKAIFAVMVLLAASTLAAKIYYIRVLALSVAFVIPATFYLWVFTKAIEKSCMYRLVEPSKLTEGDWIVNDVYVGKKYICGPKDLGIEKRRIRQLIELYKKGKVRKILIKEGIPFVPSFLIAFVVTIMAGNPLGYLV